MITDKLINPKSILVVGGSNDLTKPGGKVVKNIIDGNYSGNLYIVNRKEKIVQGIDVFSTISELPDIDLAIISVPADFVVEIVEILTKQKNTGAFIIFSAGFSEANDKGKKREKKLVEIVNKAKATLIGPNCIGVLTPKHHSVFTSPIPKLNPLGCDFISSSGATASFIMEAGIPRGLTFANVFSIGNSAQTGVEEIIQYMDETFDAKNSSKVKLLYLEKISKPQKFLRHTSSLIHKGCKIAAIKAGSSDAGSRAVTSHTGALATSDIAVDALFKKAGIVRCYSREELIGIASVFMHPPLKGENIVIITHAGGPAIMLTDTIVNGGLKVPKLSNIHQNVLSKNLFAGSSVGNPIDFLATGTAEQLGFLIDYVENEIDDIAGMIVIFGSPGLFPVFNAYDVLYEKMQKTKKPVYAVLPSIMTAQKEVEAFISKGGVNFPDEVTLGKVICRVNNNQMPISESINKPLINKEAIRKIADNSPNGYLETSKICELLDAAGIKRVKEVVVNSVSDAIRTKEEIGMPIAMKVVGPIHKSDLGGVRLNINDCETVKTEFEKLMKIEGAQAIVIQPMLKGQEFLAGVKYEENFGHIILCGLGGIFVEILKDFSVCLAPLTNDEALHMIRNLKSYEIIKGVRGQEGINEIIFAEILVRLSLLVETAPEINELDLNPLIGNKNHLTAVDARINIKHV